jgi:hypothetical protein
MLTSADICREGIDGIDPENQIGTALTQRVSAGFQLLLSLEGQKHFLT